MIASSEAFVEERPGTYRAILWGGTTAGVLDITAAFVNSGLQGRGPILVLQGIASGLLGRDSYAGGLATACLGLAIHFFVAFCAATVYYAASRRLDVLIQKTVASGLLYGVAVYCFMYLVVLPLTFHRSFVHPLSAVIIAVIVHMCCVGLPISVAVRRFSK